MDLLKKSLKCKRCGSLEVVLFKEIHRCNVCDSTNIMGMDSNIDRSKNHSNTDQELQLWNPNAAAIWSLFFTPIFGAWIHARNWKALNRQKEARWSMMAVCLYILFYMYFVFHVYFIGEPKTNPLTISVIIFTTWYFSLGKMQAKHVKESVYDYNKKSLIKPLLFGVFGYVLFYFYELFCDKISMIKWGYYF